MVRTPTVVWTIMGNTEEMKIRKIGEKSPTPNHRIATGIQAMVGRPTGAARSLYQSLSTPILGESVYNGLASLLFAAHSPSRVRLPSHMPERA